MHPALTRLDHRPWPLPKGPWRWRQTWRDLLFAHWPVRTAALRSLVPRWLTIQEFDGSSWVGLVPFTMTGVTLRGVPALPVISRFPEMNLRLYVEHGGKPGVWFVSLDANSRVAVWGARRFVHLPYFLAEIKVGSSDGTVKYHAIRRAGGVTIDATYGPAGPVVESSPGTLSHFLTERYCLYTQDRRGRPRRLEIHHHPWPLQAADADFKINRVAQPQGIELPTGLQPILHFSRRLDVIGWSLEVIDASS